MYGDYDDNDDVGYEVEEIGAEAIRIQRSAAQRGVQLPKSAAIQLATRRAIASPTANLQRRPLYSAGRGSGMATSCPLGSTQFAAATPAGTIVNLQARSEEPFTATKLIIQRHDFAAIPPAVCAGLAVLVLDVRIGQRSVLSNAAGIPVEAFDPEGTGGQTIATGVVITRSTLVTIQFQLGALLAVPAAEQITLSATLMGVE